jgi:hypothetical protein
VNARTIVAALAGGRWCGSYGTARCPAHDDRRPSLSVGDTDGGKVLVRCHAGCDQTAVIDALRARGLWPSSGASRTSGHSRPAQRNVAPTENIDHRRAAARIWCEACAAAGTIVDLYLDQHRGYRGIIPPTIRCAAALRHRRSGLTFPAMVAAVAVWPSREVVAVHRTYLDPDTAGKASVDPVKMMLGKVGGGAVRLAECGGRLAISEGIETGLLAQYATGIPTWAALSAVGMERIVVPALPLAREVFILADCDVNGRGIAAARILAHDLVRQGRTVRIAMPATEGADWADVLTVGVRDAA